MSSTRNTSRALKIGLLVLGVGALLLSQPATASDRKLKEAQLRANAAFAGVRATAKVQLRVDGRYHVTPDGLPTKQQGRKISLAPALEAFQENFAVGAKGWLTIEAKPPSRVMVSAGCCYGLKRLRKRSLVFIHFDRPIGPEDLAPNAIARAISGFFDLGGLHTGVVDRLASQVEITDGANRVDGIAFDTPLGWSVSELGSRVHIGHTGSKMEIHLVQFDLSPQQAAMPPKLFLEQHMPDVVLGRLRRSAKNVAIKGSLPTRSVGPLYVGGARIDGGKWYFRQDWVVDPAAGKAYHFYAVNAPRKHSALYDSALTTIRDSLRSVRPGGNSVAGLGASVEETARLRLPAPADSLPGESTVLRLAVGAEPQEVRRGDTVELTLDYEIAARQGEPVTVTETRTLTLSQMKLPNYPVVREQERPAGRFTTSLPQVIPRNAALGEYLFKGEVCVKLDCISRSETFTVVP